jgi:hypothetical protein
MTTSLTYLDTTVTPDQVVGWKEQARSGNRAHQLLSGRVEVTHRPLAPRTFDLSLLFIDESSVTQCTQMLRSAPFFDLETDDLQIPNGRFALNEDGTVQLELDPATQAFWTVTVTVIEVSTS